jgi:hypothetical protein
MTNEWPFFLAPEDKIVPIIAFRRKFLVKLLDKPANVGILAISVIFYFTL